MNNDDLTLQVSPDNVAIVKDEEKCIKCGYCVRVCRNDVTVSRMYELGITKKPICINCGQCANYCPTEAISEKLDYMKVLKLLKNKDKTVVFSFAPAVRVALGEEFGLEPGVNVDKKIISALKKLGAKYVFDITFGADLTVMEEAMELVNRIQENKNLPMFTSCCPAWIKYVEIFYPELIPNLSTCKSPIAMQGSTIKTYFAKMKNINPEDLVNVVIAPCTAKKYEIRRDELNVTKRDTDFVLTTRELARMIKENDINFLNLEDSEFDSPLGLGSGAGVIFGNTGGVAEAALRTAYHFITNKDLKDEDLVFSSVRGMAGVKEAQIEIEGKVIKVAVLNGMKNAKNLIDKMKEEKLDYQFIEVMNCIGGCIAGGGQPKLTLLKMKDGKLKRIDGLYSEDEKMKKRVPNNDYHFQTIKKKYNELGYELKPIYGGYKGHRFQPRQKYDVIEIFGDQRVIAENLNYYELGQILESIGAWNNDTNTE